MHMPLISNIGFSVKFDLTGTPTLVLTDTTTSPPSGFAGIFEITQPDGYVRTGNISSPDISSGGGSFSFPLTLASDGGVQNGEYTIKFTAVATSYLSTDFTRQFQFQYEAATLDLREEFDVFTPKLEYYDDTVYAVSNFNNGSVSRSWSVSSTPTGLITGTGSSIDIVFGGDYYDANYTVTLASQILYTHQTYSWLTVLEAITSTVSTYAETPPTPAVIVGWISDLKTEINRRVDEVVDLWTVKEDFKYAQTLFDHILDKIRSSSMSGIYRDIKDLVSLLHNYQTITYTPTNNPIDPFDVAAFLNSATWGAITGSITDQVDLINYISAQVATQTGLIKYTQSGTSTEVINIPSLPGKTVIAIYRATAYKRPVTGAPSNTDEIGVNGVSAGTNKGIISTTGEIILTSGDALVSGEYLDIIVLL